jgi:hypothetical protein
MSKLLYIGQKYKKFVSESIKLGVNRNIPARQLRSLKWGERITTAKHEGYKREYVRDIRSLLYNMASKPYPNGKAHLLLDFNFTGLSFHNEDLTKGIVKQLEEDGKIKKSVEYDGTGIRINRYCGTYHVRSSHFTDATIEEIIDAALAVSEDMGISNPKCMISGRPDTIYGKGEVIEPISFSRGLQEIEGMSEEEHELKTLPVIHVLGEYEQWKTVKEMRESIDRRLKTLDDYFDNVVKIGGR